MTSQKITLSSFIILLCLISTIAVSILPSLYQFGMNTYFLSLWDYYGVFLQFLLYSFLHGWILHFVFNAIFILYFWNQVEYILWWKTYLLFFLWNTLFIGILLLYLTSGNTVWMSGFGLAVLTYYTLHLRSINNPEYTGGITAIVINIAIGFTPGISLLGHLLGAIFGVIFFYGNQVLKKRN